MTINRIHALLLALGLVLVGIAAARAHEGGQAGQERSSAEFVLTQAKSAGS